MPSPELVTMPAETEGDTDLGQLDHALRLVLARDQEAIGDVSNAYEKGGLVFRDHESIDCQRRVVWRFIKTLGWNVMSGNAVNIISVSLPVRLFEPRSFLGRLSDTWSYAPDLLSKAAKQTDPVERFKYVIAFAIASLHLNIRQLKPFNPILGETLQTQFSDGTKVYLEQSSHHPPVSHFQVFGPDDQYKLYGHVQYSASWRGNRIKGSQTGQNIVEFADGTRISYTLPYFWLSGILYGERVAEYLGEMNVEDTTKDLTCQIVFNPDGIGYLKSWFVSSSSPSDTFRGDILRSGSKVDSIEGSWISEIRSNGVVLVDVRKNNRSLAEPVDNPLPSDSRYRTDLQALAKGDFELAQTRKVELEELQRKDRALRKAGYEERDESVSVRSGGSSRNSDD